MPRFPFRQWRKLVSRPNRDAGWKSNALDASATPVLPARSIATPVIRRWCRRLNSNLSLILISGLVGLWIVSRMTGLLEPGYKALVRSALQSEAALFNPRNADREGLVICDWSGPEPDGVGEPISYNAQESEMFGNVLPQAPLDKSLHHCVQGSVTYEVRDDSGRWRYYFRFFVVIDGRYVNFFLVLDGKYVSMPACPVDSSVRK
jgi:hypothetical protein